MIEGNSISYTHESFRRPIDSVTRREYWDTTQLLFSSHLEKKCGRKTVVLSFLSMEEKESEMAEKMFLKLKATASSFTGFVDLFEK